MSDSEWIRDDPRVWLDVPTPCTGCGEAVAKAEVIGRVTVGWCDLCWQRFVVRWKHDLAERMRQSA